MSRHLHPMVRLSVGAVVVGAVLAFTFSVLSIVGFSKMAGM